MTDEKLTVDPASAIDRLQAYGRRKRLDGVINSLLASTAHERRPYWSYREAIIWAVWRNWAALPFSMDQWPVSCGGGAQTFLSGLGAAALRHVVHPNWNKIEISPQGAHGRLVGALEAGGLVALGINHGERAQREIPTHEWVGLSICDFANMNMNAPDDRACRHGIPLWGDIVFKRSDIERLFPPIPSIGSDWVEIADPIEGEDAPGPVVEEAAAAAKVEAGSYPPYHSGMVKNAWLLDPRVTDYAIKALGWENRHGGTHADFHSQIMAMSNGLIKEDTVARSYRNGNFWVS